MPELPEVETIKNVLKPHLTARRISAVTVYNYSVVARPSAEEFTARLQGQTLTDFTRRGKFLTLHFLSGDSVVLHLRMTGRLTIEPHDSPLEKHTHAVIALDDGKELRYTDTRRFGRFWYIERGTTDTFSGKDKTGAEPFDITFDYIKAKFGRSKKPIKELLLDQSVIAGIGNIYSDEICFAAKILPEKAGGALTEAELKRLCETIPERLAYFIGKNEITFEEYALTKGRSYRNTPYLQVYGKKNKPCPVSAKRLQAKQSAAEAAFFVRVVRSNNPLKRKLKAELSYSGAKKARIVRFEPFKTIFTQTRRTRCLRRQSFAFFFADLDRYKVSFIPLTSHSLE